MNTYNFQHLSLEDTSCHVFAHNKVLIFKQLNSKYSHIQVDYYSFQSNNCTLIVYKCEIII